MPVRKRQSLYKSQRNWRRRLGMTALILLGFGLSGGIGTGIYFLPAIKTAFSDLGQKASTAPIGAAASSPSPGAAVATPADNAPAPASGQPFTLLLLGSDNDSKFSSDHSLTQSMILCRVDPTAKKVTMLSIPRDLWVPLSVGGTAKIDAAYSYGGAQAAIDTVENNFHVHV